MMETQSPAQNLSIEIDSISIMIYGKQGHGKTLMAILMAITDWRSRIYSNFSIYDEGIQINKTIQGIEDIKRNIRFSYTPGVILIDEAGINVSSRKSMSEQNEAFNELLFLMRKKNCSIIWISQREKSMDVNIRELSGLVIEMQKIRRQGKHPIFIATRKIYRDGKLRYGNQIKTDTISILERLSVTYNTLENSKIEKQKEEGEANEFSKNKSKNKKVI